MVAELPFILMHPKPEDIDENNIRINESSSISNSNGKNRNTAVDNQYAVNATSSGRDDVPNLIQLDG